MPGKLYPRCIKLYIYCQEIIIVQVIESSFADELIIDSNFVYFSRYGMYYVFTMENIEHIHPGLKSFLEIKMFSVQAQEHHLIKRNKIPPLVSLPLKCLMAPKSRRCQLKRSW